jgi:hypothetical protein
MTPRKLYQMLLLTNVAMKVRSFFDEAADSPSSRLLSTCVPSPCRKWLGGSLCVEFSRARLLMAC